MIAINKIKKVKNIPINFYKYKIKNLKSKVNIHIETNSYIVKTAQTKNELLDLLKLRFEVFLEGKKKLIPIDFDEFDLLADHIIIIDKKTGKPIGTYRLISSLFSNKFYSETEFYIDNIKKLNGNILEMGRAAIKKDHRNGITIALLWKGIADYVKQTDSKYLFGCSSVYITDPVEAAYLYLHLRKNYFNENLLCEVKPDYVMPKFDKYLNFLQQLNPDLEKAKDLIPSLLKAYLNAGSSVCSYPALDREFQCIDFLTVLNTDNLTKTFERKYKKSEIH